MPSFCCVVNCTNKASSQDKKSFFRIPAVLKRGGPETIRLSEERRERWFTSIKRSDINPDEKKSWLRVCEDHFITGKPADLENKGHPDWIPTVNMGYKKKVCNSKLMRYERIQKRGKENFSPVTFEHNLPMSAETTGSFEIENPSNDEHNLPVSVVDMSSEPKNPSVGIQTDLSMADIDMLEKTQKAFDDTVVELTNIKNKFKMVSLDSSAFENDDEKTRYYTGVSTVRALLIIFKVIEPYLNYGPRSSLNKFEQFILTLMHLRLNLDFTDLAYRFGVSKQTASRIFHNCLFILYQRLHRFILWPEREDLMKKMPQVFLDAFGRKVTVIIDCFEIFTEKPSNVMAAAQTYSRYKSHNTTKYLIAISPQGVITFISTGWAGRTSDKHIVQNCGILDKLLPGDFVLADRGFTVKEEFQLYCAELVTPAFTKGRSQLPAAEVESTRNLAHVRIHVERVIGSLRQKFRILHNVMPISLLSKTVENGPCVVDQIVTVCSCLTNIAVSVVPFD